MRILYAIFLFIALGVVSIYIAGFVSDPEYIKTKSTLFDDKVENVWLVMTDVEQYINSKKDIQKIEITDKFFDTINSWEEFYPRGGNYKYKVINKDSPNLFILKIDNDFRKTERTLEYYLSKNGDKTKLTITEISTSNDIFWRGVSVLLGRDNFIDGELKWIRVALFDELIDNT